jgi:2-hydroxychromene-2-carboxylate isomerase
MLKSLLRRSAAATLIAGVLLAGGLGAAGEASAAPQRFVMSGLFRIQNCLGLAALYNLHKPRNSQGAWCVDVGLPPGWARLWRDIP